MILPFLIPGYPGSLFFRYCSNAGHRRLIQQRYLQKGHYHYLTAQIGNGLFRYLLILKRIYMTINCCQYGTPLNANKLEYCFFIPPALFPAVPGNRDCFSHRIYPGTFHIPLRKSTGKNLLPHSAWLPYQSQPKGPAQRPRIPDRLL